VIDALARHEEFLIIGHVNPDGDALGSAVALARGLTALGRRAVCAVDDVLPERLAFLAEIFPVESFASCPAPGKDCCIVAVDCGDLGRLGQFQESFSRAACSVVIDHHATNTGFGMVSEVRVCGATGQIILELLERMGAPIDAPTADALYTALSTDTGNFTYNNTDEAILAALARLRGYGADIPRLGDRLFRRRTLGATRLIGRALERLEMHASGKIALMTLLLSDFAELRASKEESEDLVNFGREIDSVEIAIFLRQIGPEEYKVSLRSQEYADVASIACTLEGGGHKHAAGCTARGSLAEVKAMLVERARALL